jgi:hypothetical protein
MAQLSPTGGYGTTPQDAADAATFGTFTPEVITYEDRPNPAAPAASFPAIPQWLMIAGIAAAIWYFMLRKK